MKTLLTILVLLTSYNTASASNDYFYDYSEQDNAVQYQQDIQYYQYGNNGAVGSNDSYYNLPYQPYQGQQNGQTLNYLAPAPNYQVPNYY